VAAGTPTRNRAGHDGRTSAGSGIELQGLVKSFRNGQTTVDAVRNIDVSIAPGETVALLGPNGAGKSTTIDLLLGLARPDGGTVSVFGGEPSFLIDDGKVGAMLQTGSLIRRFVSWWR
jgi:ABC-2 type transport system ATP-binding protein